MILDAHIHIRDGSEDRKTFLKRLKEAGVDGGIIISLPPPAFPHVAHSDSPENRMDHVLSWCEAAERLYPFYWIDPIEDDAHDQVDMAIEQGAAGFKIICDRYFPSDERLLAVVSRIAEAQRPVLFHSGILWDGKPSSRYNRPSEFEGLLGVKGLRFSLAHIAWPWCDELIAVYGKFLNAYRGGADDVAEMFIDTTPGTPRIYRQETLRKLFGVGYDIENNVVFGSDSMVNNYNAKWVRGWLEQDHEILKDLGVSEKTVKKIYADNIERFLGICPKKVKKKRLMPGEE